MEFFFFFQQHTKETIDSQTTKSLRRYSTGYNKGFTRKKNLKRSFGLRSWLSQSLRRGVGVWVIIKSNSCNSQWNSALAILIVRVDNDLDEREQFDLRLVHRDTHLLWVFAGFGSRVLASVAPDTENACWPRERTGKIPNFLSKHS